MKKVSVVIPVYNAKKTLHRCLDGIVAQTYNNFEVICVDDGSKDNSFEILKQYASKDGRIKIYSQKNHGPAYTRNFAISKVSGDYLMFCDADDWYEPEMIETMVKTIEEQNVDLVMCDCNVFDLGEENVQIENIINYHYLKIKGYVELDVNILPQINVVLWNKIFKMDIIRENNIVYPTKYEHDDTMFFVMYCITAKTYYGLDKHLYNYYTGNINSLMGQVRAAKNIGREYDCIFSYRSLFDYVKQYGNVDYLNYVKRRFILTFLGYLKFLPNAKVYDAFKNIKNVFDEYLDIFKDVHSIEYVLIKCISEYLEIRVTKRVLDEISIVMAGNNKFVPYLGVTIKSIIDNSSDKNNYTIYILSNKISKENKEKLRELQTKNVKIQFKNINPKSLGIDYKTFRFSDKYSIVSAAELFIPLIFNNFDRVVYCTYEGIFQDDVAKLSGVDLGDKAIGAVKDYLYISKMKLCPAIETECFNSLEMKNPYNYLQDGILVFDIPKLKEQNYLYKLFFAFRKGFISPQKIINYTCDDKVCFLDGGWNFQVLRKSCLPDYKRILSKQSYEEYLAASKNIKFLHYTGSNKPWKRMECKANEYYKIARKTPFKNVIEETKITDKSHKIINIFGIKIKIKRKQK